MVSNRYTAEKKAEQGVLRALVYSSIFHFPLTQAELSRYAQSDTPLYGAEITGAVQRLGSKIVQKDGYFCLRGQETSMIRRRKNRQWQKEKLQLGRKTALLLGRLPTVLFIGISGTVAAGNAELGDDIDLFVITASGMLWLTRLLLLLLLELTGKRRTRNGAKTQDMICLNMLVEERKMKFSLSRQDIYTARECVQMLPVFTRGNMYQKFLLQNNWIAAYLAGGYQNCLTQEVKNSAVSSFLLYIPGLSFVETMAYRLQRFFMNRHRTRETVEKEFLALHPRDYRQEVLVEFEAKIQATGY